MASLIERRRARNLTLTDVSDKYGVSIATLSRMERGLQIPRMPVARKLAKLYGVTVGDIYNGIPDSEAENDN